MNKTIYEAEFTKMVHDKMREANRFKEYVWNFCESTKGIFIPCAHVNTL